MEFSGVATSSATVDTTTAEGPPPPIPTTGSVTTVDANSLLFFAAGSDSDEYHRIPNPGSGWTLIDLWDVAPEPPDKTAGQYRIASTAKDYSGAFSSVSVGWWAAILVAYAPDSGPDTTPPTMTSATIQASGDTIALLFDETVTFGSVGNSGFTVSLSGGAATLSYSSGSGTNTLNYSISRTIQYDETGTISYTQPGDGVEDTSGNDLANIRNSAIKDASTVGAPAVYHWVSTSGAAAWSSCVGSSDPGIYCSMSTANANASPGDTINIVAGTYSNNGEIVDPFASGQFGSPITYQAYGGTVTITGSACDTGSEPAVNLNGDNYVIVDGINSSGCEHHLWITNGADYNEIKNCSFDDNNNADWNHSVIDNGSQYNWIHNCQFSKGGSASYGGDDNGSLLDIGNEYTSNDSTSYNLIEDCVFFHGGHHVIGFMSSYNTFRNNYIHNEAWTSGYGNRGFYGNMGSGASGKCLIEGNRFGYTAESVDDGYVGSFVVTSPGHIIRYNMIYHNEGYGMGVAGYSGDSNAEDNRIYNNTFFNNGLGVEGGSSDAAVYVTADAGQSPTGNVFKNNLYYSHYQNYGGNRYSQQTYVNEFTSGDPLFTNASILPTADKTDDTLPDLTLSSSSSPAIDVGGALTTVSSTDSGAGTLLIVSDASYFQDGTYAPSGKVDADWIAVGTIGNVSQIDSISGNTITLMNTITRNANDPVWLYKKSDGARVFYGSAPDAGAHEFSETQAGLSPPKNLRIVQ
jgi:hypothetical protein